MSYLRYVSVFAYSGVNHTYWGFGLVCLIVVSYVPNVACFTGLFSNDYL